MDEQIKRALDNEGYAILRNVIPQKECTEYIQILEQCYERFSSRHAGVANKSAHGLDDKNREKIVYNLHNKHVKFLDLLDHPGVFPYIRYMLQQGSYQNAEPIIHTLSSARSPKQGDAQQLHIDSRYPGAPFALSVTVVYCLEEFTKEKGATRVIPGSHLLKSYPENGKQYDNEVIAIAPAGSVIIFNGALWHGSSVKSTDQSRWGAILSYARWFIKPSFDLSKNVPADIFSQMTDQQKELLGFKFNPPIDEFTRISARSTNIEVPEKWYCLPQN